MNVNTLSTQVARALRWLPAAVLAVGLAACGGGSGSPMSPPATGQTNAARVSVGSITGFGSVHVNGVTFETTSAAINVNGQPGMQSDLKVGEIVEIKGHHDGATGQDVAEDIEFRHNVQGPVAAIDTTNQTLTVLCQNVVVSADTAFGDGITPASLAGLKVTDIVEVSGMVAADGGIQATRIEKKPAGAAFEVTGKAAATSTTAKTLAINGLTVDFSGATLTDFPSTGPKDGDLVEARATTAPTACKLAATRLELLTGKELNGEGNEETEVEGLITRFASATDFDVAGRKVTTSPSTVFVGGASTDLALNVRVEAEGKVNASGVLEAARVRIQLKSASLVHIVGPADKVDPTAGTVTVLGITISLADMTHVEDDGSMHVSTFKLADVHTGDWLDIRGGESPAGSNHVVATRLRRVNALPGVLLAGIVKTATQPKFTILSVNIDATTATFADGWHGPISATTFFTNLVGQRAVVIGTWNGTILTAKLAALGEGEED
jgi:hypothetical protein